MSHLTGGSSGLTFASLEALYKRLFATDGSAAEFPQYERKDFYLSSAMIEMHGKVLVETIAGIANAGLSDGVIMCRGRGEPPSLEDAQRLDLLARTSIFPAVTFTVDIIEIAGRAIHLIIVPRSNLRPHFMRDQSGSNRFFVPLRGAANNATAARHQIDEMYRESTLDTIRRAFPGIRVEEDDTDRALEYVMDIGYGFDPE